MARALALEPKLIVLDEPVSALDVSVQAQIINLLDDLQEEFKLTYLFVAHDLSVVRHVSDRIAVMYLGKLMEVSPSEELYTKPIHPYTFALLSAIPIPDPNENRERERIVVSGEPPNPIDPPSGCVFHPRCPRATDICREVEPPLARYPNGHLAACHHPMNVTAEEIKAATKDETSPFSCGDELPAASEGNGAGPDDNQPGVHTAELAPATAEPSEPVSPTRAPMAGSRPSLRRKPLHNGLNVSFRSSPAQVPAETCRKLVTNAPKREIVAPDSLVRP